MNKPMKSVPSTTTLSPTPEETRAKHGPIAAIREAPHVPPEEVPEVAPGVEPLDAEQKRFEVYWVPGGSQAELDAAMAEIERGADDLACSCGPAAPDTSHAPGLARRIADLTVTTRKAEDLYEKSSAQLHIARSDAHELVKSTAEALRFIARRDTQLLRRWPAVLRYADAHAASVLDGIDKAKRAREASKKADAKKAETRPPANEPASDEPASDKLVEG